MPDWKFFDRHCKTLCGWWAHQYTGINYSWTICQLNFEFISKIEKKITKILQKIINNKKIYDIPQIDYYSKKYTKNKQINELWLWGYILVYATDGTLWTTKSGPRAIKLIFRNANVWTVTSRWSQFEQFTWWIHPKFVSDLWDN
jgi:hypothetical protein